MDEQNFRVKERIRDFLKNSKFLEYGSSFFNFYLTALPMLYAIILLQSIDSFKQIPGLTSSLFEPGFTIGLWFVILATIPALLIQFNSERRLKSLGKKIKEIQNRDNESNSKTKKVKLIPNVSVDENNVIEKTILDLRNWWSNREIFTKDRTFIYLVIIGVTLLFIHIVGQNLAESVAPHAFIFNYTSTEDPNFELKQFEIEYSVHNIDEPRFHLMKPTEILQFDFKIKNNSTDDVELNFSDTSYVGGTFITKNIIQEPILIKQNTIQNFSRNVYLNDIGINGVYFHFEFEKPLEKHKTYAGIQEFNERVVGETIISYRVNVISQSDYDSRIQQYYAYYYLAVVASPLVLIGVRSFKEILEDKKIDSDSTDHKIYR